MINYLLNYYWGRKIKNIFKIFLVIFIAIQPLHSYTTISINNSNDTNGFEYLHAELCGTKYTDSISHTKKVSNLVNIPIIASGGVGSLEHLHQGIKIGKANAVLAASIFHFGEFSIEDAKKYLDSKGIPVRI